MHLFVMLLAGSTLCGADFTFSNAVELHRREGAIVIGNERDRQELTIMARNVVAVMPSDRNDNNSFTSILARSGVVKLQERMNHGVEVVKSLSAMGFAYVTAVSDRDSREPDTYLINVQQIDFILRTRTGSERSDTVIYFSTPIGSQPGSVTVNQSAQAYAAFIAQVDAARN